MKLIIWDLDNTIWEGKFAYDGEFVEIKPDIHNILKILSKRGFLHSIASRNPPNVMRIIDKFKLTQFFIFPQTSWQTKDIMISNIIKLTHILPKDIAFIDDELFNINLIKEKFPEIMCIYAGDYKTILDMQEFQKENLSKRNKQRKKFFDDETRRIKTKEDFTMGEFLEKLDIHITIKEANNNEKDEVIELLNRANQLHATGNRYDKKEFDFRYDKHKIIVGYPEDSFGAYGMTMVAVISIQKNLIIVKELIISCRILDRGLIPIFLITIQKHFKIKKMQIIFKRNYFNETIEDNLLLCGFKISTNGLTIEEYITNKTNVRIKNEL